MRRITTTTTITTPTATQNFKPKKAGAKDALVVFLLDASASMGSHKAATISGFNEFLEIQKLSEIETKASLYEFTTSSVTPIFKITPVSHVAPLTNASYSPRGMTNLYDAIGQTMNEVNDFISLNKKKNRPSVTFVILTDGMENSSSKYNDKQIKQMIELAEGKDWSFFFLGANIDAFAVGGALGIRKEATIQYDMHNIAQTMGYTSMTTNLMKNARSANMSTNDAYSAAAFTDEQRKNVNR